MRVRQIPFHAVFIAFTAVACASAAKGQVTALHIVSQSAPADVLPGYVVNDLLIDFNGQYTGSQMIVELTRGEIYQDRFGSATPPNPAWLSAPPTVEWDTFVANGGPTLHYTIGRFELDGAAVNIEPVDDRPPLFTDMEIDQSWHPAGGNEIFDQTGFMVARVTLSRDATGTFKYIAAANQVIGVAGFPPDGIVSLPIRNGSIVPEPATVALLGLACMGAMAVRSRSPLV